MFSWSVSMALPVHYTHKDQDIGDGQPTRCVFDDNADITLGLDNIEERDDVGMPNGLCVRNIHQ